MLKWKAIFVLSAIVTLLTSMPSHSQTPHVNPSYSFEYAPELIKSEAREGRYLKVPLGRPFLYSDFIGAIAYRRGLRFERGDDDAFKVVDDPSGLSTIAIGFGAEYKPDGKTLTEPTKAAGRELQRVLRTYLRGEQGKAGAAAQYGAFISSLHPIVPPSQGALTQDPNLTAEKRETRRKSLSAAYVIETSDRDKSNMDMTLPIGTYIVLFNDVNSTKPPDVLHLADIVPFLETHFAADRHIFNLKGHVNRLQQELEVLQEEREDIDREFIELTELEILLQCGDFGLSVEASADLSAHVFRENDKNGRYKFPDGKMNCPKIRRFVDQG